jgi:hypothetical protein
MVLVDISMKRMLSNVSKAALHTKQHYTIFCDPEADKKCLWEFLGLLAQLSYTADKMLSKELEV